MTGNRKAEIVIIGAGPGGYAAAFRAADLGLEVTLIDPEANPGGVCLYRGCIPSKTLLHIAKVKQDALNARKSGINYKNPKVDLKKINAWKYNVVEKLTTGLGQLAKHRKIGYIRGKAKFRSENSLDVEMNDGGNSILEFQKAVIATGSIPTHLPHIKIDHQVIMDSTDALELKDVPDQLLVIGGGYIGLELGSVYAALGSKVTIAEMTSGLLPGADRDLVDVFEEECKDLFEALYLDTKAEKVDLLENGKAKVSLVTGDGKQIKEYDKVLVAVGRKPNTDSLNLGKANLKTDEKGFLKVNEQRKTQVENIYAIGDITGEPLLAHKATHEGRVVAEVLAGEAGAGYAPKVIPGIVFTHPEIAWCGVTETQVEEKKLDAKVIKFPWTASGKAVLLDTETGLTKLIFDAKTGRILGGGVAGKDAGILISQICLAIEMAATAQEIAETVHPHPTLSETIMEAAELFLGSATHLESKQIEKP
ncbi:dihydrolipoyl dehydrogenase [Algoriphagus sp. AGSA1]|uniref:dihydrolipoyl dehydrogenase n=1 Tax=Algoriphagus sp. AGSA1 TaxID=2907213 RepID=UPI001F3F079A|nr:dihydrolipoyl dehydrogenase [Algoriphagus sp. AGSA1]MCE7056410.1 dihydrolipoyl dehydrogenase [Algoriphagus sp. AGSA1]